MKTPTRTALALTVLCGTLWATSAQAQTTNETAAQANKNVWQHRAKDAYSALQRHLYQGPDENGLYLEMTPRQDDDNPYSFLWPLREAAAATVDMAELPRGGRQYEDDAAERFETLELYYNPRDGRPGYDSYLPAPLGQGGDVFYDDNAVVGLSLLDQYRATDDATYLERAEHTFGIVGRGWDTDPDRSCPGGMHWVDADWNEWRAANVTGLAAQLAAELYEETREDRYLASAQEWYEWTWSCLRQSPGLYDNDLNHDGSVNPTLWTYNSGAMIGTATTLYQVTGDESYLDRAVEDADASLDYWTQGSRLHDQPAIFNAIYFDNLLILDAEEANPAYREAMAAYGEATWHSNRDAENGLFRFEPHGGGDYHPDAPAETLEQSAMIQIFATLAQTQGHHRS